MADVSSVKADVVAAASAASADLNKLEVQYGFVRTNWGKLSAIVVTALAAGNLIGVLFHI